MTHRNHSIQFTPLKKLISYTFLYSTNVLYRPNCTAQNKEDEKKNVYTHNIVFILASSSFFFIRERKMCITSNTKKKVEK